MRSEAGRSQDRPASEAVDIPVAEAPEIAAVRAALEGAAVDVISTPTHGRRKSLLVADMDSTIVTGETLDELADFAGLKDRIAAITARAMNGELDFKAALRERVAMLQGLPVDALERTWQRVRLTPGARELVATMRAHGALPCWCLADLASSPAASPRCAGSICIGPTCCWMMARR